MAEQQESGCMHGALHFGAVHHPYRGLFSLPFFHGDKLHALLAVPRDEYHALRGGLVILPIISPNWSLAVRREASGRGLCLEGPGL